MLLGGQVVRLEVVGKGGHGQVPYITSQECQHGKMAESKMVCQTINISINMFPNWLYKRSGQIQDIPSDYSDEPTNFFSVTKW